MAKPDTLRVTLKESKEAPRSFRRIGSKREFLRGKPQDVPASEAEVYRGNPLFDVQEPPPPAPKGKE